MSAFAVGDAGEAAGVEGVPAMTVAAHPDAVLDAGEVGGLVVRLASVRGAGHRYDGTPRQDDVALGRAGAAGEWLVVAVADGVSAGPLSHVAARAAVRFGVQHVTSLLAGAGPTSLDWSEVVGATAGFVLAQARRELSDPTIEARDAARQMATTLAIAVVPVEPDADGVRRCVVVPLGDTSVWVLRPEGWEAVTAVKNDGEAVASSATLALPLLPAGEVTPLVAEVATGDALFVMTDGVGDPLGDGRGEVGEELHGWWALPPDRYTFAAQVDFARRSHTDDRTAVGVWCEPPAPLPQPTLWDAAGPAAG